jgi:hypothetical protein
MKKTQKHSWIAWILALFVGWRVVLGVVGASADLFLPYAPSFPYYEWQLPKYGFPRWIYSWGNFDGVHYLLITEMGYSQIGLVQAFFPVFPLLVQALAEIGVPALMSGLFISNVAAIVMCLVWYGLVSEVYDQKTAFWSLLIILLFPTAFFFGALYSESLFLALVLGSFWAAHRRNWWLAAGLAMVASATRVVGVFLVPALMIELWLQENKKLPTLLQPRAVADSVIQLIKKRGVTLLVISTGILGLLAYMTYLGSKFKDPLYFLHVQSEFGGGREERIIIYPQVVWRYIKILVTYRPVGLKYLAYVQEMVAGVVGLVLLLVSFKGVRWSWLIFSLGAFLVPTMTGTFSSMPRYVLVCFPLFIFLAQSLQNRPRWLFLYLLGSAVLLLINTVLFIQGYWVA